MNNDSNKMGKKGHTEEDREENQVGMKEQIVGM